MRKLRLLLLPFLLVVAGCENELPHEFGQAQPELMVTGFLSCGAPQQTVQVSLSEKGTVSGVEDATVRCYVNGVLAASASAHSEDKAATSGYHQLPVCFSADFAAGDVVVLEIEADGYKASTPELTVPPAPLAESADTVRTTVTHADSSEEVMRFTVDMQDRKGEDNWYALTLMKRTSGTFSFKDGRQEVFVENCSYPRVSHSSLKDPILLDGNMALAADVDLDIIDFMDYLGDGRFETFSDQLFRNGPARLVFDSSMQYYYRDSGTWDLDLFHALEQEYGYETAQSAIWPAHDVSWCDLEVQLHGCSQATYFYLRALRTVRSNAYNPVLVEPATIPCNIIGGTGFVDILNTTTVPVGSSRD